MESRTLERERTVVIRRDDMRHALCDIVRHDYGYATFRMDDLLGQKRRMIQKMREFIAENPGLAEHKGDSSFWHPFTDMDPDFARFRPSYHMYLTSSPPLHALARARRSAEGRWFPQDLPGARGKASPPFRPAARDFRTNPSAGAGGRRPRA